jgi:hypothetical protein
METYNKKLKQLPKSTTYSTDLTALGKKLFGKKYKGTFASDQIPILGPMESCILNVDKSHEPGSHWIALVRGKGQQGYVYDSFGRRGASLIPSLSKMPSGARIIDSDLDAEQTISQLDCGARCLAFLYVFYTRGARVALTI